VVGLRAALMGVGTDIGGSIRVPALCCGTFGYRPSAGRIPYGGQGTPGRVGSPGVVAVAGPLTTSFRDVRLFMETVLSQQPWSYDHSVLRAPWRQLTAPKTLAIGLLPIDPAFPVHPPMQRALQSAITKLKAAGHTIVPLGYVPSIAIANQQIADYYSLDPAMTPFKNIEASGEPKIRSVAESPFVSKRNGRLDMDDLYTLNANRAQCLAAWHKVWTTTGIDVILGPVAETTAMPHDTFGNTPYTTLYNYLDVGPCHHLPNKNKDTANSLVPLDRYPAPQGRQGH
jgi:amidase